MSDIEYSVMKSDVIVLAILVCDLQSVKWCNDIIDMDSNSSDPDQQAYDEAS